MVLLVEEAGEKHGMEPVEAMEVICLAKQEIAL